MSNHCISSSLGGFIEYIFLKGASLYNPATKLIASNVIPGAGYDLATCEKAGLGNAYRDCVVLAEKLLEINFTNNEFALLHGLSMLSAGRLFIRTEPFFLRGVGGLASLGMRTREDLATHNQTEQFETIFIQIGAC